LRYLQVIRAGQPIELSRVTQQSAIASLAHIGDDAPDCGQHTIERRAAAPFKSGKDLCRLPGTTTFCSD
jgi:hypothetical protein